MIRPSTPADTPALIKLAQGTQVFNAHDIVALQEVLDDYHASMHAQGHCAITLAADNAPDGFAYYAPAQMTDRSWYLYWIAVHKPHQGLGIGRQLLRYLEADIASKKGRILFIETSSLAEYAQTHRFYEHNGYLQTAVLLDYYRDGDNMVVFRKRLEQGFCDR